MITHNSEKSKPFFKKNPNFFKKNILTKKNISKIKKFPDILENFERM